MKKLGPSCEVVNVNSPPNIRLRKPTGKSTRKRPSRKTTIHLRRFRKGSAEKWSQIQIGTTKTHIRAFSRVSPKRPCTAPIAPQWLQWGLDGVLLRRNKSRVIKKRSRTVFCISASKKIAGA